MATLKVMSCGMRATRRRVTLAVAAIRQDEQNALLLVVA
jgi:hypothetical protein